MDMIEMLRATVAEFLKTDPGQLHSDSKLTGPRLQSSLGRAALDAAIRRRMKIQCPAAYSARTYGDLEAAVLGTEEIRAPGVNGVPTPRQEPSADTVTLGPAVNNTNRNETSCGIDIEPVSSFAPAEDYWESEFYRTNFSAAEIAYCLLQEAPPMHFAVRWSAKEALKKCDNRFIPEKMAHLELTNGEGGAPALCLLAGNTRKILPFAVSVSHTPEIAVAVVIRQNITEPHQDTTSAKPAAESPAHAPQRFVSSFVVYALTMVALGLSLWALFRTF